MTTHIGNEGAVYVGANAVAEVRSWSLEVTADTVDDTVMGDTWKTNKATHKAWSGSANVLWDETDTTGQGALVAGAEVTLNLYPEGNTTGDIKWSGSAIVTAANKNASYDGLVEASISFIGNGALTEGTAT